MSPRTMPPTPNEVRCPVVRRIRKEEEFKKFADNLCSEHRQNREKRGVKS
jgi:hypothetical protein